jgi:broad specificity phosphatase PhoE
MSTELILIRHGHASRLHGNYYRAPLTILGREQAEKTGQFFSRPEQRLDALYASTLLRAHETADLIGSRTGQTPSLEAGIIEAHFPEVLSLLFCELLSTSRPLDDYLLRRAGKPLNWPIEGRVARTLLKIMEKHHDQRVGVVAHAGVISGVLSWLLPVQRWHWWRMTVSNCSITRFLLDADRITLLGVNQIEHLSAALVSTQPPATVVEMAKEAHPPSKNLIPATEEEKNANPLPK